MDLDEVNRATNDLVADVRNHSLPDSVGGLIEEYETVLGDRDRFLWKWLHALFPAIGFSCVDPAHAEAVREAKLVASTCVATVDDLAEKHGDRATFEEAAKVPFPRRSADPDGEGVDRATVEFAERAWREFEARLDGFRAEEFGEILLFDVDQVLNGIRYSALVNGHLSVANLDEMERIDSQNTMLFVYADIDLLHSPTFETGELSSLRRLLWNAQRMARIGNWITTWERELAEEDFSSGVVVSALEGRIVTEQELTAFRSNRSADERGAVVERIRDRGVEDALMDRWREAYADARRVEPHVDTLDVGAFLDGMETVHRYHRHSRVRK